MSDADFKLFDIMRNRMDNVVEGCEHEYVFGGVCDGCFEILHHETKAEFNSHSRASPSHVSKHNRVNHFIKVLDKRDLIGVESSKVLNDFEDFIWAFDGVDRGSRKNFLLNGWVLWKISERRGIKCEKYNIKNAKSREEHERLGRLVFEKLGWV